jgi:hypothetical protein
MRHLLPLLALLAAGCGGALPEPVLVRVHEGSKLAGVDVRQRPIVVELMPGDEVPLDVKVDGDLITTAPDAPPLKLVARRHFFVRFSKRGLETSLDNVHYGDKIAPGSFAFGVGFTPAGPRATIQLSTPKLAPRGE